MASKLSEPLQIGSLTIKNRTFMAPISLGYEDKNGRVNEIMQEYWLARAKGGVGCIILDALSVDPAVPYLGNTLCFRDEESIASYRAFTDRIHEYGTKIIPQITHPGPESASAFYGIPPVASSSYINAMGQKTRALDKSELPAIVEKYAQASYQAKLAGFDGIELHSAHAYMLLGSFLSPMRNKRTDEYGGTLLNRARLLFEVIDAIKARCGADFPILLRISGSERSPEGNTVEDIKYLVPKLIEHGIDGFEISGSTQYEQCNKIIPCHGEARGLNVPEAEAIKAVSTVPVVVVGKINDPDYARYLVDSGRVDGIVIGRALLSDPDFVRKTEEGRDEEIAPCAACAIGCVGEQTRRRHATCVINPALGREKEMELTPAAHPKKAVIVGGGIGGMSAARAFAMRGHNAVLIEKSGELGGQLNLACIPPHKQEIGRWVIYLKQELKRLNVPVVLDTEATKDVIDSYSPDIVVLATGAKEFVPPVPGIDRASAITAQMVLKNETAILGGNVLVVGGGMVGCEVCEYLMQQKRGPLSVTLIEMMPEIAGDMVVNNRLPMMKRLAADGIRMMPSTKLLSVVGGTAEVESFGKPVTLNGFTHIVYACGSKAEHTLYDEIKDAYPGAEVVLIGDACGPRQALEAMREGWEAALKA